jgi:hypothetical protein
MSPAAADVAPPALLRLHVVEGPQAGKQLEKKGLALRVGRTTKSPFYLKDPAISEQHAEVAWQEGSWRLRDLGSTNGTTVNGKALAGEPSDWLALKDGDLIKFGTETVVRVEIAAVTSDSVTVEEFVTAECTQLEQRIRCAATQDLCVLTCWMLAIQQRGEQSALSVLFACAVCESVRPQSASAGHDCCCCCCCIMPRSQM